MKKFKVYDLWINIILIFGFTIFGLIKFDYSFLIGYCVVGAWQIISMFIHGHYRWFSQKAGRRFIYHNIVFVIFLLITFGFLILPLLYFILLILLFAAPFMAVYYTLMCYNEVYVKMQRPISLLK